MRCWTLWKACTRRIEGWFVVGCSLCSWRCFFTVFGARSKTRGPIGTSRSSVEYTSPTTSLTMLLRTSVMIVRFVGLSGIIWRILVPIWTAIAMTRADAIMIRRKIKFASRRSWIRVKHHFWSFMLSVCMRKSWSMISGKLQDSFLSIFSSFIWNWKMCIRSHFCWRI